MLWKIRDEREKERKKKLKQNKIEKEELVIYFQLISYSNVNNKKDDT